MQKLTMWNLIGSSGALDWLCVCMYVCVCVCVRVCRQGLLSERAVLDGRNGGVGQLRRRRIGGGGLSRQPTLVQQLQTPLPQPQRHGQPHLLPLLPALPYGCCQFHPGLPVHLPAVHGGKRAGVYNRAREPAHADRHQPVYPQLGHQRSSGGNLLYPHHTGGQPHHR